MQENEYTKRIKKIRELIQKEQVDGMLISQPAMLRYLTGFRGVEPQEREAFIFITLKNQYILTRKLYFIQSPQSYVQKDILYMQQIFQDFSSHEGIRTIGIEAENLTVAENSIILHAGIQTLPLVIKTLREEKDVHEIGAIKASCSLGDAIFARIVEEIQEGITELQLKNSMENMMREKGYLPAFDTIIAFGKNAAEPHHVSDDTRLEKNRFVLFDFGLQGKDGYQSDMTRTVFFGEPTKKQRKLYDAVLHAQVKVTDALRAFFMEHPHGFILGQDVDKIARDALKENYPEDYFCHGLGHSIGLETHEQPYLNTVSDGHIRAGLVFSNEPGLYIPGEEGVRIEDLLTIHADGTVEELTKSSKEFQIIPVPYFHA